MEERFFRNSQRWNKREKWERNRKKKERERRERWEGRRDGLEGWGEDQDQKNAKRFEQKNFHLFSMSLFLMLPPHLFLSSFFLSLSLSDSLILILSVHPSISPLFLPRPCPFHVFLCFYSSCLITWICKSLIHSYECIKNREGQWMETEREREREREKNWR